MLLLIGFGLFVYCTIAFVFFALSAMELAETRRTGTLRLLAAVAFAAVWPLTVLAMTIVVCFQSARHADRPLP